MQATIDQVKSENQNLKTKLQDQAWKVKDAEEKQRKAEASTKEKEEARAAAQTELDDLFVVLGDLEEKRTRDKVSSCNLRTRLPGPSAYPFTRGTCTDILQKRLKELGEEISDAEDDDEDGDEDEEEEEE